MKLISGNFIINFGRYVSGRFTEIFINAPKNMFRKRRRNKILSNLSYVIARMKAPHHEDVDKCDTKYRLEAVCWLYEYYKGTPDFVADGPPDVKLKKILSKPTRDVSLRDHVFTRVFYYWKEHRRVEGF